MLWHYKDLGLTREEAESKILSIGFKPAENKGWEMKLKKGGRFHIVPSAYYMNMHRDNPRHRVVGGSKNEIYLGRFRDKLNKLSLYWRIKLKIRKYLTFKSKYDRM